LPEFANPGDPMGMDQISSRLDIRRLDTFRW
jgi:hypothetical protein